MGRKTNNREEEGGVSRVVEEAFMEGGLVGANVAVTSFYGVYV